VEKNRDKEGGKFWRYGRDSSYGKENKYFMDTRKITGKTGRSRVEIREGEKGENNGHKEEEENGWVERRTSSHLQSGGEGRMCRISVSL
jgi:hypothetical protein